MKLGLITSILDGMTFEEVVDFAENGLECLEVACWPREKATRRYAGVSHIDVDTLTPEKAEQIKAYCEKKGVEIPSLAYYPNPLDPDTEKRERYIAHLHKLIDASALLGVNMITTFIGRDSKKNVSENLELVKEIWPPILKHAEEKQVKVGIENCPMLFTQDEWPGGQNIMTTPANWRKVFEILDSPYLGINYDPSHFVWQRIPTTSSHCMSSRTRSSMYIIRTSRCSKTSWGRCRRNGNSLRVYVSQASGPWRCRLGQVCFRSDRHWL